MITEERLIMEINEILGYVTALTTIVILVLLWIRTRPVDIEDAYKRP